MPLKPPIEDVPTLAEMARRDGPWAVSLGIAGKSPKTITTYLYAVEKLNRWLAEQGRPTALDRVTLQDHERFMAAVKASSKPATAIIVYRSLWTFWQWAAKRPDLEMVRANPMVGMTSPQHSKADYKKAAEHVSADELRAILKTCVSKSHHDFLAIRDRALILTLAYTGLRLAELTNLRVSDLSLEARTIRVVKAKGDNSRTVPLSPEVIEAMRTYLTKARPRHTEAERSDRLWLGGGGGRDPSGILTDSGVAQVIASRGARARLSDGSKIDHRVHPHELRHFAADMLLDAGVPEAAVMAIGGWSSRQMLDRYAQTGAERRAHELYADAVRRGTLPRL